MIKTAVGFGTLIITLVILFLVLGVLDSEISSTYSENNVSSTWTNLKDKVIGYGQTGFKFIGIGVLIAGAVIVMRLIRF